jgi:hypothetical protein
LYQNRIHVVSKPDTIKNTISVTILKNNLLDFGTALYKEKMKKYFSNKLKV